MKRTTPKPFQLTAIESGLAIFSECKRLLDMAGSDATGRAAAVGHHGALLIEAPTGAGKTLIAGQLAERFSALEPIVWFWFAPFKGVTGQTAAALRADLPGLRLRELTVDRQAVDSRQGDVWVTTWQTVATKVKDGRNVHRPGEQNLTVEELVAALRAQGLRIGVVVDEAHHGFFGRGTETQAMRFFKETLQPEYTVLITATPDDADVQRFEEGLRLARLNRVTIGRHEPVEEGLIKEGIKCVAYVAPEDQAKLVDFERVALRDGVAMHRRVKAEIKKLGVDLSPLLLVQVDSTEKSVERAKDRLVAEGFTEAQIAIHTAEEPDSGLLALANDPTKEVLIFKMAVALGFDAPRAGILVSMRAARDEDFGVQLVGRILRVHRRLQAKARAKTLPPLLRYGYVFLANAEGQTGIDLAGQRINKLQTTYATVSPTTALVMVGGQAQVQALGSDGQTQLLRLEVEMTGGGLSSVDPESTEIPASDFTINTPAGRATVVELLSGDFSPRPDRPGLPPEDGRQPRTELLTPPTFHYARRAHVPTRFKTQVVSPDNDATEEDCAQRFIVSSRDILEALAAKVQVERRTLEVFTQQLEIDFTNAAIDPEQAAKTALKVLTRNETFDSRELRRALLRKLKGTLREIGLDEGEEDERVGHLLNVILTAHPELLYEAQKEALALHYRVEETDEELPDELVNDAPLVTSRLNVYGAMPPGMNSWETDFARVLDGDSQNVVNWWHRNEPRKAWSVQVVLEDGRGFFPDFVIGVADRPAEEGVLLADPKHGFEVSQEHAKAQARHPIYGQVLILHREAAARWMTVRYDTAQRRPVLDREFRLVDASGLSRRQQNGNSGTGQASERHADSVSTRSIKEHDVVRVVRDMEIEGEKFAKGMEGTVVSVYRNGEGYAVEFEPGNSQMVVVTVYPTQIMLVR
jgi:type III restriction enzyme